MSYEFGSLKDGCYIMNVTVHYNSVKHTAKVGRLIQYIEVKDGIVNVITK